MSNFNLKSASKNREVKTTIDKKVDPYFMLFFEETKKQGETIEAFVSRTIGNIAVVHFARKKNADGEQAYKGQVQILQNELSTFLIENNLNIGS